MHVPTSTAQAAPSAAAFPPGSGCLSLGSSEAESIAIRPIGRFLEYLSSISARLLLNATETLRFAGPFAAQPGKASP